MRKLILGTIIAAAATFSLIGIFFAACGSPPAVGSGGVNGNPGGNAGTPSINLDASSLSGQGGGSGVTPTADANCGTSTSSTTQAPADVLLVLDRSGSMSYSIAEDCYCDSATATSGAAGGGRVCSDTTNCSERWQSLTSAVDATLASTPGINWGLKLFSSLSGSGGRGGNSACNVNSGVEVQIGASSAAAIQAQIAAATPANNTPTAAAITAATAYLKTVNDPNNKVILLATDGEPNCAAGGSSSTTDVQGTVDAITAAKNAGFKVYVIGIGPSVGNLDNFASAGGTGNYYPATSPQALADALAAIGVNVTSCTFTVTRTSQGGDLNNLAVYLDGKLVPATGWTYTASSHTVDLTGSYCDAIKNGTATTVEVYLGCGEPPPPLLK